jgi:hypothetical protein
LCEQAALTISRLLDIVFLGSGWASEENLAVDSSAAGERFRRIHDLPFLHPSSSPPGGQEHPPEAAMIAKQENRMFVRECNVSGAMVPAQAEYMGIMADPSPMNSHFGMVRHSSRR